MIIILEHDGFLSKALELSIKSEFINKFKTIGYNVEIIILQNGMKLKHIEYGE